jgi:hypothetical protein
LQTYFHRENLRQAPKLASQPVVISSVKRAKRYSPTAERFDAVLDYKRGVSENQAFRRKKFSTRSTLSRAAATNKSGDLASRFRKRSCDARQTRRRKFKKIRRLCSVGATGANVGAAVDATVYKNAT